MVGPSDAVYEASCQEIRREAPAGIAREAQHPLGRRLRTSRILAPLDSTIRDVQVAVGTSLESRACIKAALRCPSSSGQS